MFGSSNKSHGFTIPELIVAILAISILTIIVFDTLGTYYYSNTTSLGITTQDTDTRTALRQIESDLSIGSVFYDSAVVSSSELGPKDQAGLTVASDRQWTVNWDSASTGNMILASTIATTTSGDMVALTANSGDCGPDKANFMKNLAVYFVKNNVLYRRTIVNWSSDGSTPTPCAGYTPNTQTAQKTSCAPSVSSSQCVSKDAVLARNVSSLQVKFYTSPTSSAPVTASSDLASAKTVDITVSTTKKINGASKASSAKLRFTVSNLAS